MQEKIGSRINKTLMNGFSTKTFKPWLMELKCRLFNLMSQEYSVVANYPIRLVSNSQKTALTTYTQ